MQLLIDGDILAYKASAACETPINIYEDTYAYFADVGEALAMCKDEVNRLCTQTMIGEVVIAFSDAQVNFRKKLNPTYKANRSGTRKPLIYKPLREAIEETYPTVCYPTLEADDTMGILGSNPLMQYVLVSIDKDMRTIPCKLVVDGTIIDISKAEANRNFLIQALTGDTTDNYKGCVGIGAVKAKAALAKFNMISDIEQAWEAVVALFLKAGQTVDEALLQARMARILRHGEYDLTTGEISLWKM